MPAESSIRRWGRRSLGLTFIAAGVLHFIKPAMYEAIVPPSLPRPRLLVLLSGVFEVLGGLGVLSPWRAVRRVSGWGLAALLVAVFPANLFMATHNVGGFPAWLRWGRLPLQLPMIAWALWASGAWRGRTGSSSGGPGRS